MRNSPPESPVSSIGERPPGADAGAPLTSLFESMRPDLLRFAQWLARDRSIAEDIVQEALLRAWRSREALKDLRDSDAGRKAKSAIRDLREGDKARDDS